MKNFKCPFCGIVFACTPPTHYADLSCFANENKQYNADSKYIIDHYKCPTCGKISTEASGMGSETNQSKVRLHPLTLNTRFEMPHYVPTAIKEDYQEAFAILELSPKASATLARRCLQGIIHDFWNIREKNLNAEITTLKKEIPAAEWAAIDAIRKIGNIGAHMEHDINLIVDIDPEEADTILQLIELLIKDWYIARHDREELLKEIAAISDEKAALRKQDH